MAYLFGGWCREFKFTYIKFSSHKQHNFNAKKERERTMSRVRIENEQLIITMQGARKLFSLKSEVSIHLDNVTGVRRGLEWKDLPGYLDTLRVGSHVPGFYFGGYFFQRDSKAFYDVKRRENAVVIDIENEDFDTLVIGVDDCEATVALIEQALDNR